MLTRRRQPLGPLTVGILIGFTIAAISFHLHRDMSIGFDVSLDDKGESPELQLVDNDDQAHGIENASVANKLYDEVRVLCWIMTNPSNHKERALHIKRTWGKRCNILLLMSSEEGEDRSK